MSFEQTLLIGAIAGFTIFLGLPFARLRRLGNRTRLAASMASAGVLAFLFFDVLATSALAIGFLIAYGSDLVVAYAGA